MQKQLPKGFLLLHNISKKNNIGNLLRSACAFGLCKVFYISRRPQTSKKTKILQQFNTFGNQGTLKQTDFHSFYSLQEAKQYFIKHNMRVCGVQIGQQSIAIQKRPFIGDTVFFLGNQGTGLLPIHRQYCDYFVYIPQYTQKTASLNVSVAAGIIFHHFALWANFQQAKVYGEKYQLQQKPTILNQHILHKQQNSQSDDYQQQSANELFQ